MHRPQTFIGAGPSGRRPTGLRNEPFLRSVGLRALRAEPPANSARAAILSARCARSLWVPGGRPPRRTRRGCTSSLLARVSPVSTVPIWTPARAVREGCPHRGGRRRTTLASARNPRCRAAPAGNVLRTWASRCFRCGAAAICVPGKRLAICGPRPRACGSRSARAVPAASRAGRPGRPGRWPTASPTKSSS